MEKFYFKRSILFIINFLNDRQNEIILCEKKVAQILLKSNKNDLTEVWLKYFYNRKTKTKFSKKELKFEF